MKDAITRRRFLQTKFAAAAALTAFPSIIPASALGKAGSIAPSNRITIGCIGVGPRGRAVMGDFLRRADARVAALCDVAQMNLDRARDKVKEKYQNSDCATYHDFRELLTRDDIDAVLIGSPDHWHVAMAMAAARAGKDIYLEKPMGLAVAEDQLLRNALQKNKRVFQFGTQQRSSKEFRRTIELVRNGKIGTLKQIDVWCQGGRPGGSTTPAPVPTGLDYDRWLGPAPNAPYTVDKCFDSATPDAWKTWWHNYDYALGFIAGWGVHPLDIAYWGHPAMMKGQMAVQGKGVIPTSGACNTPIAWEVNFAFADGVRLNYKATRNNSEACAMNDVTALQQKYGTIVDHGTAFEGSEGWVMVHRGGLRAKPQSLLEVKLGPSDFRVPESSDHVANFLDAVKSRGKTICPIDESVHSDTLCHLSDIAIRLGRPLKWDPVKERFLKDDEANRKLALRPTREPWRLS